MPDSYPSIGELIPHAGSMVLLDEMLHWAPGRATCRLKISPGAVFVSEGTVDTIASLEYMAQAVAACCGYAGFRKGDGTRVGMIIGCRRFDIDVARLSVGDELEIRVEEIRGHEELSVYDCSVSRGEEPISSAQMTLYHAEQPPDEGGSFP